MNGVSGTISVVATGGASRDEDEILGDIIGKINSYCDYQEFSGLCVELQQATNCQDAKTLLGMVIKHYVDTYVGNENCPENVLGKFLRPFDDQVTFPRKAIIFAVGLAGSDVLESICTLIKDSYSDQHKFLFAIAFLCDVKRYLPTSNNADTTQNQSSIVDPEAMYEECAEYLIGKLFNIPSHIHLIPDAMEILASININIDIDIDIDTNSSMRTLVSIISRNGDLYAATKLEMFLLGKFLHMDEYEDIDDSDQEAQQALTALASLRVLCSEMVAKLSDSHEIEKPLLIQLNKIYDHLIKLYNRFVPVNNSNNNRFAQLKEYYEKYEQIYCMVVDQALTCAIGMGKLELLKRIFGRYYSSAVGQEGVDVSEELIIAIHEAVKNLPDNDLKREIIKYITESILTQEWQKAQFSTLDDAPPA